MENNRKPTIDELRKLFAELKAVLGMPPYTSERIIVLLQYGPSPAADGVVWLVNDFVQNWAEADARKHAEQQG